MLLAASCRNLLINLLIFSWHLACLPPLFTHIAKTNNVPFVIGSSVLDSVMEQVRYANNLLKLFRSFQMVRAMVEDSRRI